MQTRTIISMFFAAFILDIIRSNYSSSQKENKMNISKRNNSYQKHSYQNYQKPNFNFENDKNPSMKIKDEKGDDIKISFDKPNKKKNIIYLTIQFCQS